MASEPAKPAFTLIELLACVAVIALLAGAAGGLYVGTYRKRQVEQSCRELLLAARYGQLLAVEQGRACRLHIDKTGSAYHLAMKTADRQTGRKEEVTIKNRFCRTNRLPDNVQFKQVLVESVHEIAAPIDDGRAAVTFYPDGTADGAVLQIGGAKYNYTITIAAATARAAVAEGLIEPEATIVDLDQDE